ncbi:hypothetical protein V1264_004987 [Littorina saxatilis]|uniref:UvrC family homology region profile domain-containing protein n=1 Tax=Littorina saxatilis TaxID=31220 RepID=A0AAN9G5H0_9CAEN
MRIVVLSCSNRLQGILCGALLSYMFWGSLLLIRCGDVEMNPGPGPATSEEKVTRQTRQSTSADRHGNATQGNNTFPTPKEPTLADVMMKLNGMDMSMNGKLDKVKNDVQDIKEHFSQLQEEVNELKEGVNSLREENDQLKGYNEKLWKNIEMLETKVDDLECRSKRNNLLFYGMDREENETNERCEQRLQDLFTDKLELAENVEFDRVHRISSKPNSPLIARCVFYKDKVKVLKAKRKLKGSNIFIGEDFSKTVRDIRKNLTQFMKEKRNGGHKVSVVFDHLIIDGEKFFLSGDGESIVKGEIEKRK